ncbi:hypothetical protein TNCV_4425561 [Trichonephila clavipes]|nr:hypothetical protein TNCV_4425561 [Trichonephila clavipes]
MEGGCGCIFGCGRTDLHVFPRGNVNTHNYRDDFLDAYDRFYTGAIREAFELQGDNAKPHTSLMHILSKE